MSVFLFPSFFPPSSSCPLMTKTRRPSVSGDADQPSAKPRPPQCRKVGRMLLPESAHRTAQAIERSPCGAAVPAGAMTIAPQEPVPQGLVARLQETQEKGIGQRSHQQEFLALGPVPEPWALERSFAFVVAPGLFDLPASSIRKDHTPGLVLVGDSFIGQQIPRQPCFARHYCQC